MRSPNLALRRAIAPMLESIDDIQSENGKPLYLRPLDAADLIVRHSIIEVSGDDDKNNFLEKPWFAAIYAEIYKWYKSKYGSLANVHRDVATGLIVYRGVAHIIDIPKTIATRQEDGLVRLTFPKNLYETENVNSWIRPKLSKKAISLGGEKLGKRIKATCDAIREIGINTGGAGGKDTGVPKMGGSIVEHLSRAATAVSSNRNESNSLAMWDLHLACEKSVKSLLAQRGIQFPKTHNLVKLNRLISDAPLEKVASRIIRHLPTEEVIMRHRYQQEPAISAHRFYFFYSLALMLCVIYTRQIERKLEIGDASFFLKSPPWSSQL